MNFRRLRTPGMFIVASVIGIFPRMAFSEDIPLEGALYEAIDHNLTLRINAYQTYLREQDRDAAASKFDTSLFGSVDLTHQVQDWTASRSDSNSARLGVTKSFSTGTSVTLQSNYIKNDGSRFDTTLNQEIGGNLSYNSGITLSVRQALLQGFGKSANMASVWKAEAAVSIAQLEYKNDILDAVNQTEKAYWQVAFQNAVLNLSRSSVELAENLLKETEERAELGLATKLDVLQARANLASRQESFIESQRAVKDAEDELLVAMGRLNPDYEESNIVVSIMPDLGDYTPTLNAIWSGALQNDLNLVMQQTTIESLGYDKIIAKDRNKSELDMVVSGSSAGYSGETGERSFWGAFEKEGYDWEVGLELNIPIGKRSTKAYLNQINATIEREHVRLDQIEQSLFMNVRQAWRTYNVGLEKLEASRVTLELQREAFDQEQAKYSEGLAVFRDVQEAQEMLDRARISELNAWVAALRALSDLSRLDGSLLERHHININFN